MATTCSYPPEDFGTTAETASGIDVIEFLWASMALFDDDLPHPDMAEGYVPRWRDLYSIAEARARILTYFAQAPDEGAAGTALPKDCAPAGLPAGPALAWTSTFIASLELARPRQVALTQGEDFASIHVSPAPADLPA